MSSPLVNDGTPDSDARTRAGVVSATSTKACPLTTTTAVRDIRIHIRTRTHAQYHHHLHHLRLFLLSDFDFVIPPPSERSQTQREIEPPARVAVAERSRRSATPPYTAQLTSDDPFTSQLPVSSSSTVLSAPPTTTTAASQPLLPSQENIDQDDHPTLLAPIRNTPTARQQRPSQDSPSAPPRQLLGRRQRSESDNERDFQRFIGTNSTSDPPRPKRRRAGSMSAEGHGEASSNGTSSGLTGDSRAPQRSLTKSATNGTHKASTSSVNGSSQQNGKQQSRDLSPTTPYFGHDREEVTRILIQALTDMGYQSAAQSVSKDSGYELESPTVAAFRTAVIQGSWTEAEQFLFGAAAATDAEDRSGNGLVLVEGADRDSMRFCIRQQKYLELLELRDYRQALSVLRTELTPLSQDAKKLNFLSPLLMCQSADEVKAKADWDGADGQSRYHLLSSLSKCISPSVMLPENRLAVLLQQVKDRQIDSCFWHTSASSPSLYSDHSCDRSLFPNEVLHELEQPGEVWQIRFSHDGKRLASCGADQSTYIWDMATFGLVYKLVCLQGDQNDSKEKGVGNIAFSPDDSSLVTCGRDRCASIWNLKTGTLIRRLKKLGEPVSSCVWAPDGGSFVLGCFDKSNALTTWSAKGEELYTWTKKIRVEDVAISPDGRWLVAMDDQHRIHIYDFPTREFRYELDLSCRGTSIRISQDSKYILVNKQDAVAQLIKIATRAPVQKYTGHIGGDYTIRSDFGGANESFVISGSEDGCVFIWHMPSGHFLEKLDAHRPRCNAVAWSPTDPCLWASAGDDAKIKLWSNKARKQGLSGGGLHRATRLSNS